jgi:hypothetical protein
MEDWLATSAREFARLKYEAHVKELDELDTLDIATVAAFLNWPVTRVAKKLPVVELGPRSRRIRRSDYLALLAKNTKQPARA